MKRYSNSPSFYICSTRSKGWKHKRCHIHSFRIEQIDTFTWDCVASLLSQPELVEEQLTKEAGVNKLEQLQKRIRLLKTKVDHLQAKIRRVQDGYEADPHQSTPLLRQSKESLTIDIWLPPRK